MSENIRPVVRVKKFGDVAVGVIGVKIGCRLLVGSGRTAARRPPIPAGPA